MTSVFHLRGPAARGALLALASAALFGLSTPFVQRFGVSIGPFSTAALLYLGATCVSSLTMKPSTQEAALGWSDLPRPMGMAATGAVLGPVALAWGLQHTSGASASLTLTLAALTGEGLPPLGAALALMAVGATGYGLSLRLYVLAQRAFGASRTGSVYAFAPFVGLMGAFALGERSLSLLLLLAGALMLCGVWLHLSESHDHDHAHAALSHEHAHFHDGADDDGHHRHSHDPLIVGTHSHWHQHEPLRHGHPHVPDTHHLHRH